MFKPITVEKEGLSLLPVHAQDSWQNSPTRDWNSLVSHEANHVSDLQAA